MKGKKSILPASTKSPINASSVNNNEQQTTQLLFQEFIKTRETRLIFVLPPLRSFLIP